MKIDTELEKLAKHVIKEAQKEGDGAPSFSEKTDALKTATTLYAILTKYKQKQDDGDESATFADFAKQLQTAESPPHGKTSVRSRRGTGLSS
jgi:hypothetical protein